MSDESRSDILKRLTEAELARFAERCPNSLDWSRRAVETMPLGAPSNVNALTPYPLFADRGEGAELVDLDGNRYVDYGGGYGSLPCSHAHPAIAAAVTEQMTKGSHFGLVTEPVVQWAEHLCQRFQLDWVRFSASGTEATMDAIRLARAYTGKRICVKFDGAYHGSHADALVSINQDLNERSGPDHAPNAVPADESLSPNAIADVLVVPYNDLPAVERALQAGDVACVIVEPIMFNVGFISPLPGFLHGLRERCDRHGALLIFDEVKTGATVAWGGAQELYGVQPHIKCFAKSVCGGLPGGAFGGTDPSTYETVESWKLMHVGTLSGNPLTAAAGHAALTQVLTPDAYVGLDLHGQRLRDGLEDVIARHKLTAYVEQVGCKGCIVWAPQRLQDFRQYARSFDGALAYLAWVYLVNRGVFLAPGHDEQWTHGVAHTDAHADLYIEVFESFAQLLTAEGLAGPGSA